jgi:hypothetical protein
MTDSSSKDREEAANMAAELIQAKMELAKNDTQMTHMMRIGTFHVEIVPDASIDIEDMFNNMLDKLMKQYGDKILTMNINQLEGASTRHYG